MGQITVTDGVKLQLRCSCVMGRLTVSWNVVLYSKYAAEKRNNGTWYARRRLGAVQENGGIT
jgi:hypothetical protein